MFEMFKKLKNKMKIFKEDYSILKFTVLCIVVFLIVHLTVGLILQKARERKMREITKEMEVNGTVTIIEPVIEGNTEFDTSPIKLCFPVLKVNENATNKFERTQDDYEFVGVYCLGSNNQSWS